MTPKEKAIELFNKYADEFNFDDTYRSYREQSKQCTIITVDEIINVLRQTESIQQHPIGVWKAQEYWDEVKQEIEKS